MDNKVLFQKMVDLYTDKIKFRVKEVFWSNEVIIILVWGKDTSLPRTNAINRLCGYINTLTSHPVKILTEEVDYLRWVSNMVMVRKKKTYDYNPIPTPKRKRKK